MRVEALLGVEATALPLPFAFLRAAELTGVVARALPLALAEAELLSLSREDLLPPLLTLSNANDLATYIIASLLGKPVSSNPLNPYI